MTAPSHSTIRNRNADARKMLWPGFTARLIRSLVLGVLVAMGGALVGLGILRATDVFSLIPDDGPQIWVKSGCTAANAAVRAALHATPEKPVYLIPLDQGGMVMQSACRSTLATLDYEGYRWLRFFPERWLCQRFADNANQHMGEPIPVPRFYADGQFICDGLCEGVFQRLGRPELQQFLTFITPVSAVADPEG